MDKRIALMMLNLMEQQNLENLALRSLLLALYRNKDKSEMGSLLGEALNNKANQDIVHAQWLPFRQLIEAEASAEQVIRQFAKIAPPKEETN